MAVKRSIDFTEPQMEWLQAKAEELGISVGELVRRIIDDERDRISTARTGS